ALERWLVLGGADLDVRAGEVWGELGLPKRLLDQPTATLSGGEAARSSLAAVLLSRFDVLLLDEPTNDLDFAALERLERFVAGREGAVVLVSHDRAFLERTITAVVELDDHARTASRFEGGWAAYLDGQAVARRHAEEDYAAYRDKRGELTGRIQRQKEWTVLGVKKAKTKAKDGDKFIRHHRKATSEKQAAKISQSEKALTRLAADAVEKPWEAWELRLELAEASRSGRVVARLEGAVVERGRFTLGPVDVEVEWADRVAVLGPNGAGKTTFLAALLGRAELAAGTSYVGPGVVVGEIDQARSRLHDDVALAAAFQGETGLDASEVRTLLAKFGLGADHVTRSARQLSPGERTRAVLAVLQARGANCLVLDEPTNHLDLVAITQLEQAVEAFSGTVLLVTHDRRLLERVRITRTLRVDAGRVSEQGIQS
nr:ABC-F family ATP-binding cassette domain-containing protein [Acidimicrobiia bacterium]